MTSIDVHLLSLLLLVLWLLALLRTILNLALIPRLRTEARAADEPVVSVIIPARDEARTIGRTVRAFSAQSYLNLEIVVVDDRSADGTGEIVRGLGGAHVTVIDGSEPPAGWLGKPWALQQGALLARGDLLLFVDADVLYAPAAVRAAVAHLELGQSKLLSLLPHFEMRGFWENAAMPALAMFCFSALPTWLSNRTRFTALAIGGGTGNLVDRAAYAAAGGHEALKDSVVDDVALARLIRRGGGQTTVVRADGLVSLRMYHGLAEVVDGFTKNAFAAFGRSYLVSLFIATGCVVVHILPYALALAGNRAAMLAVVVITATRLILFRSLRYRLDSALFLHPVMAAVWLWIFIRSVWLTGIRRRLVWRGRTYDARQTRFGAERR